MSRTRLGLAFRVNLVRATTEANLRMIKRFHPERLLAPPGREDNGDDDDSEEKGEGDPRDPGEGLNRSTEITERQVATVHSLELVRHGGSRTYRVHD